MAFKLQRTVTQILLSIYVFQLVTATVLVFGVALGRMQLSDRALLAVLAGTAATHGVLLLVGRWLFHARGRPTNVAPMARSCSRSTGKTRKERQSMSRDSLGQLEQLVVLAIIRAGGESYGARIQKDVATYADKRLATGVVYSTLKRLEDKGFLSSRAGESTPERGGRRKRYYKVEASGAAAINESLRAIDALRVTGLVTQEVG